ncbi:MAG: hypothetical protein SFZ23_15055 [Planctomycetota bacterium]|nr:hypothetical protein [Planctomycetota bacterium]
MSIIGTASVLSVSALLAAAGASALGFGPGCGSSTASSCGSKTATVVQTAAKGDGKSCSEKSAASCGDKGEATVTQTAAKGDGKSCCPLGGATKEAAVVQTAAKGDACGDKAACAGKTEPCAKGDSCCKVTGVACADKSECGGAKVTQTAAASGPSCGEKSASSCATAAMSCPRFASLKSLAGEWVSKDADGDGQPDARAIYKVTAGGTAVMETLFPGTPHEMVTMYTMEGNDIVLTHYCSMGNQPRMKAKSGGAAAFEFEFVSLGNGDASKDTHMSSGMMKLNCENTMTAQWQAMKDGKPGDKVVFELTRAEKMAGGAVVAPVNMTGEKAKTCSDKAECASKKSACAGAASAEQVATR